VARRQNVHGLNELAGTEKRGSGLILADQFRNIIVALLMVAAAVSFIFGELAEGIAIIVVVCINASIGFATELRATRSMEALRRMGTVSTKVRRDSTLAEVSAESLVPGDIVVLEGGDIVTADIRLLVASKLQADESAMTGEALPVGKLTEPVREDTVLAERSNMLFKGTAITRGSAEGVVTATGMSTELGHISSLVEQAEEEVTPLERRLDLLGRKLIWVTLIVVAIIAGGGILAGRQLDVMLRTAIARSPRSPSQGGCSAWPSATPW
jgi:Ca2+-transporting ATPase